MLVVYQHGHRREVLATAASFLHIVQEIQQFLWNISSCKKSHLVLRPLSVLAPHFMSTFSSHTTIHKGMLSRVLHFLAEVHDQRWKETGTW
jgi:hypothetical protein